MLNEFCITCTANELLNSAVATIQINQILSRFTYPELHTCGNIEMQRVVKAKTHKGRRFLQNREPKIVENTKKAMFVSGSHTSPNVRALMKELYLLKKADAVMYKKKNNLRPFEDMTSLEFFSQKSDASLFMFGSHSKKRPNNIVLGRLFDYHLLDMVELGVEKFTSMFDIKGMKCAAGIKPCLLFTGEAFEQDPEYSRLKSLLIDFFRGPEVNHIRLAGLEHAVLVSAIDGKILIRNYRILMKKSGSRVPRIELEDMGPSIDLVLRRTKLASDDLYQKSLKKPKQATAKKKKNISKDPFGSKLGRIHMTKQNLDNLQTRKMKGLKRRGPETNADQNPKKRKETENNDSEL